MENWPPQGLEHARPKGTDVANLQRLIARCVENRDIVRVNEGEPFTLMVTKVMAGLLQRMGVTVHPTQELEGTDRLTYTHFIDLEPGDIDLEPGAAPVTPRGILSHFNNNMDTLMQALNGIHVVGPKPVEQVHSIQRVPNTVAFRGRV